jgi:glycosyltransferase involved in cell wall biosynthesis
LPDRYKGYTLVRTHGLYFAAPPFLDFEELQKRDRLRTHTDVLRAPTRAALKALIDRTVAGCGPEPAGACEGYELFRHGGGAYAVPAGAAVLDLKNADDRRQAGALTGATLEEVRDRIRALKEAQPVEFAGWLPPYVRCGNCGKHPQFAHTDFPPPGYYFTRSAPAGPPPPGRLAAAPAALWGWVQGAIRQLGALLQPATALLWRGPRVSLAKRLRLLAAAARLFLLLRRGGGKFFPVVRWLRTREFTSQLLLADCRRPVFLATTPFTLNQFSWIVEIEDPITLFFPFIHNGDTFALNLPASPYYPIVRSLLESPACKGVVTHMRSTARMVSTLFRSEAITRKIAYVPLGVRPPARWQKHDEDDPETIRLLFTSSWSQHAGSLQLRGGLDVLEAFAVLRERYPQLRLTLRTSVDPGDPHRRMDDYYHRIIESGWVRVINRFISQEEMEALHAESHIFLLPAARVHIVSLLQAMGAGLAVVASDGWGFEEYVSHENNGLIVKGRYGKTSWADEEAGMLREDYEAIFAPDPVVVEGIIEAVSRLVEDPALRRRLGRTARREVETKYSLERWNQGLKAVFDRVLTPAAAHPAVAEPANAA